MQEIVVGVGEVMPRPRAKPTRSDDGVTMYSHPMRASTQNGDGGYGMLRSSEGSGSAASLRHKASCFSACGQLDCVTSGSTSQSQHSI